MKKLTPATAATTTEEFEQTAVKLSQGPLGIIALFIVLIHGFASLVLGFSQSLGPEHRSILVWFLVLFPALVFMVFAWLVSTRHQKLYPPTAFRNEDLFRDLAYGRASFDQQMPRSSHPEHRTLTGGALNRNATGSLFWLGHDLMWTADTLLRQGPTEHVLIGLEQALHHLDRVGLKETEIERDLRDLRGHVQFAKDLPASTRDEVANMIGSIIDRIGVILEAAQGDFQVPPHWNRIRPQRSD